jgi:hypothetical protein
VGLHVEGVGGGGEGREVDQGSAAENRYARRHRRRSPETPTRRAEAGGGRCYWTGLKIGYRRSRMESTR